MFRCNYPPLLQEFLDLSLIFLNDMAKTVGLFLITGYQPCGRFPRLAKNQYPKQNI